MATFAYTDAFVSIGGTDLSSSLKSASIEASGVELDVSAMGDSWRQVEMGHKQWSLNLEFNDDMAASSVDSTIWSAFNAGVSVAIVFRPTSAAVGAGNPEWTGNAMPISVNVGGSYGDLATKTVTWPGDGTLTRATS